MKYMDMMRWERFPVDKHLWAFYYYCKRQGDQVKVIKHGDGTADLYVRRYHVER